MYHLHNESLQLILIAMHGHFNVIYLGWIFSVWYFLQYLHISLQILQRIGPGPVFSTHAMLQWVAVPVGTHWCKLIYLSILFIDILFCSAVRQVSAIVLIVLTSWLCVHVFLCD